MQRTTMRSSRSVAVECLAHILDPYIDPRRLRHSLAPKLLHKHCCRNRVARDTSSVRQESYTWSNTVGFTLVSLLRCRERRSTG